MNKTEPASEAILMVISAPSGCGKTTIVDRLLKRHPDWVRSISATTRPPRQDEKHGEDYLFLSASDFQQLEEKGELLESAKVFDYFYGTPKNFVLDHLKKGKNVILAIDIQGTRKVQEGVGRDLPLLSIFVLPPSLKVLRERLEGRKTETSQEIQRRMEVAQGEIKAAGMYDFTVVNQNLEQTVSEIEEFVEKFRKERRKNKDALRTR